MATRFYLPASGTPEVTPGTQGAWTVTTSFDRIPISTAKASTAMASKSGDTANSGGVWNARLLRQGVSIPLATQTITGTVKAQIRASESNAAANANVCLGIFIISNDGSVKRGALFDGTGNGGSFADLYTNEDSTTTPPELATSLTNRSVKLIDGTAGLPITSTVVQYGDRVLVEWGFAYNAGATARTINESFGDDSGTDLPENQTTTAANNPWVEFSQTLLTWTEDACDFSAMLPPFGFYQFMKWPTQTVIDPYVNPFGVTKIFNLYVMD